MNKYMGQRAMNQFDRLHRTGIFNKATVEFSRRWCDERKGKRDGQWRWIVAVILNGKKIEIVDTSLPRAMERFRKKIVKYDS